MLKDTSVIPPPVMTQRELLVWSMALCMVCVWALGSRSMAEPPARSTVSVVQGREREDGAVPRGNLRLDLNSATQAELELLPGIGPHRARAILKERNKRGAFGSVWDLCEVPELSKPLVRKMEPLLAAQPPPLPHAAREAAPSRPAGTPALPGTPAPPRSNF